MLTITTEKQTIYINIDLFKSRLKSVFITLLKAYVILCLTVGILAVLYAGCATSDINISTQTIVIYFLYGLLFLCVGYVFNFIKLVVE